MVIEKIKETWEIDKAMKRMNLLVNRNPSLDRFETMEYWHSLKAYIYLLELDLKNAKEKLNGLRIQSK